MKQHLIVKESVENATEKKCDAVETATTSNEEGSVFCMGNYLGAPWSGK